ncbi:BnaCnng31480D [Brassica napus]|uniref:BnaCnng31480D protein n=3 Tax=Brassica TaxID=3705 RepID=A0A078J1G8_BRANA|nr:BnaCnng31480D [Brassica napus]VDD35276.1 unnamed protein product [Brassica oleracea]
MVSVDTLRVSEPNEVEKPKSMRINSKKRKSKIPKDDSTLILIPQTRRDGSIEYRFRNRGDLQPFAKIIAVDTSEQREKTYEKTFQ